MSRTPKQFKCEWCKQDFMAVQLNARFCGRRCHQLFEIKFHRPVPFYTWCNGYCLMVAKDHPRARPHSKRVKRARLMMEAMLGRYLTGDEIVHHKDGQKWHDVPENLSLMTLSEHCAHSARLQNQKRDALGRFA